MVKEEAMIGFVSGAVYGLTSLAVGHPLDTLKTKMQAQSAHLEGSSLQVFLKTIRTEGIVGLYRGCVPPLLGSSILRSVQFGAYTTVLSFLSELGWFPHTKILGIDTNIVLAGIASGASRALIECPLEVAKIRRQVGESWQFKGLHRGLGINMARNVPLLCSFFIFVEYSKGFDIPAQWRPFLTGSVCATLAWTLVWPFDVIKSQVQGTTDREPFITKVKNHYARYGWKGFARGFGPGATRSLIANGLSMVMYTKTQNFLEQYTKKLQQTRL